MNITENLKQLQSELPKEVTLVAVSKTKSVPTIMEAYETGHRIFGENKIQEMTEKWEQMPKDVKWHMIGHVQTNKVKYMAPYVSLVHAVDRLKLLKELNKQAAKHDRTIPCLLQIKIAEEDSKFGMSEADALKLLESETLENLPHVSVDGLMGMATFTEDEEQLHQEFSKLETFYQKNKDRFGWHILSMGMSGDYPIALQHGSTMVRVGSAIFGPRN